MLPEYLGYDLGTNEMSGMSIMLRQDRHITVLKTFAAEITNPKVMYAMFLDVINKKRRERRQRRRRRHERSRR